MEKYSFGKTDEKKLVDNFAKALKDDEFGVQPGPPFSQPYDEIPLRIGATK